MTHHSIQDEVVLTSSSNVDLKVHTEFSHHWIRAAYGECDNFVLKLMPLDTVCVNCDHTVPRIVRITHECVCIYVRHYDFQKNIIVHNKCREK